MKEEKTRDPDRLNDFYDRMKELHKENYPDIRFGQLMLNFSSWLQNEKDIDMFFPEENKLLQYFEEYCYR